MSSARWAVSFALLLGCLPIAAIQACGGSGGASAGGHDGGGGAGDDGTVDDGSGSGGDGSRTDGSGFGDGALGGDGGPCTPGCPASVTCGRYTDCTGKVLTCGAPCTGGKSCITSGGSQSCQTPSCTGKCGEIAVDSCGVAVNCGGCPTGEACVDNACVTQKPQADAGGGGGCGKLTCSPAAGVNLCGTVSDGCGNTKACTCPMGQDCTGGLCTAPPPECAGDDGGTGSKCGTLTNACGSGQVTCGGCTGNNKCENGTCTGCAPPACGSMTCGEVNNGCGAAVNCGTCSGSEKCTNGTCCTPQTCSEAQDAGLVTGCGPIDLGCGVQEACMTCGKGEVCRSNACCAPQTCAQAQDAGIVTGCDPVDLGCGVQQVCAACATGQVCRSNACCTPLTCAEAADAGTVTGCNPVDLGCGVQQSCAPCPSGQSCQANKCVACAPKTCSDFGNTGCDHSDGCGNNLDCCASGTTCMSGGLCCQPGDVVYQGSCCLPQCNPSLPAGPQASCGTVIYCGGAGSQ